jgi:hypothetical protein
METTATAPPASKPSPKPRPKPPARKRDRHAKALASIASGATKAEASRESGLSVRQIGRLIEAHPDDLRPAKDYLARKALEVAEQAAARVAATVDEASARDAAVCFGIMTDKAAALRDELPTQRQAITGPPSALPTGQTSPAQAIALASAGAVAMLLRAGIVTVPAPPPPPDPLTTAKPVNDAPDAPQDQHPAPTAAPTN